ncbi:MAG: hypothetical protein M0O96_04215 [Desulforhopalus sp.]|nr:hypothetical protein [Desulforhopalus sp.]
MTHSIWMFLVLAAGLGLCQFIINISLLKTGILSDINIYFGTKAMLAYDGAFPKLENIGGVYPPFPYFLVLIFRDPLIASAVAGGLVQAGIVAILNNLRREKSIGTITTFLCIFSTMFLPQLLFVFTQRIDLSLTVCAFTLTMWSLRRVELCGQTYHLTICSLCMFLLYLCDPTTLVLCLLFAPYVARRGFEVHHSVVAVLVLTYLPLIFFALIQRPMSLLLTGQGNPFEQWRSFLLISQHIDMIEARPGQGSIVTAASETIKRLFDIAYLLVPWAVAWGLLLVRGGWRILHPMHKYFLAPLLYCGLSLYLGTGIFERSSAAFLIFPLQALLLTTRDFSFPGVKQHTCSIIAGVCIPILLVGGWFGMVQSPDKTEQQFVRALLQREPDHRLQGAHNILNALKGSRGRILMDPEQNMELIFFSNSPRRFLLPEQLDYEMGISLPAMYVDYVVVYADPNHDAVARRHPSVMTGKLAGFDCILKQGKRLVFKRTATASRLQNP